MNESLVENSVRLVGYIKPDGMASHDAQLYALRQAGCVEELIYIDNDNTQRSARINALKACRPGGVLLIWDASFLADSHEELDEILQSLKRRRVTVTPSFPFGEQFDQIARAFAATAGSLARETRLVSSKKPRKKARLWRYMDFSKLMDILNRGAIYFARADRLGDPFEGARGGVSRQKELGDRIKLKFKERIIDGIGDTLEYGVDPELAIDACVDRMLKIYSEERLSAVRSSYVSCWHQNISESEAFWYRYCPNLSAGVAVYSDFGSLRRWMVSDHPIEFGVVTYTDFAKTFATTIDGLFIKRECFSHENEVRAVIRCNIDSGGNELPLGMSVAIPIERVVHGIVVSPFADYWFKSLVKEIVNNKFGLNIPVRTSILEEAPFY